MLLTKNDIQALERKYRLNLINSISGVKPANLIGTRSQKQEENLAIFSSVVHLGSNPAQLGMVLRPQTDGLKDTYANILETGYYTINHVSESFAKKAHYTSAKLPKEVSEFEKMKLSPEYVADFEAPFVAESQVKMGMKYLSHFTLPNECIFVVGEVELLLVPDASVNEQGQLDVSTYNAVGISGLNTYYRLEKIATFPYVRVTEIPDFNA